MENKLSILLCSNKHKNKSDSLQAADIQCNLQECVCLDLKANSQPRKNVFNYTQFV